MTPPPSYPTQIRLLSLNCWGLKYISTYRRERLREIGAQIARADPPPDIVGLQECWTQEDYESIREQTRHLLPYAKFYYSGIFGAGLAVLSKWPIEESSMFAYPLNGRPTAFWRGDWFVGKGVACARIRVGPAARDVVQVFNTHLHAPYSGPNTSGAYLEHRTSQAWEIAKHLRCASEAGHLVIGMGDFNIVPSTLAYRLIRAHGGVQDVWRALHPDSAIAAAGNRKELKRRGGRPGVSIMDDGKGKDLPTAMYNLTENGTTCDSALNTWRWEKQMRKQLHKGEVVDDAELSNAPDLRAKRLDYIFLGGKGAETHQRRRWKVDEARVGMTARHPTLHCSLSDHFSVEATISCEQVDGSENRSEKHTHSYLPPPAYDKIRGFADHCIARARRQRKLRLVHLGLSVALAIGCFVGVWWSPRNYVAFILLIVSTLGFGTGVVDGLIGGLFFTREIRALQEWRWEVGNAKDLATQARRGPATLPESGQGNLVEDDDWDEEMTAEE